MSKAINGPWAYPLCTVSEACGFNPPDPFRVHQRFVILFGLPRVTDRKLGKCVIKSVALAAIACDHSRIAGLGVRQRQRPAAYATVIWKYFDTLYCGTALHVRKLTRSAQPRQEDNGPGASQGTHQHQATQFPAKSAESNFIRYIACQIFGVGANMFVRRRKLRRTRMIDLDQYRKRG